MSSLKAKAKTHKKKVGSGTQYLPGSVSIEQRNPTFENSVKECEELFELLGVPVLKAEGEAEALCSQLNRNNDVDAVVTSDSDALCFGAKCIIKHFDSNSEEPFECYQMVDIEGQLGLKRNHLIAISLLVGNDFDREGVTGIGIKKAFAFVKAFSEDDIFNKLEDICKGNTSQVPPSIEYEDYVDDFSAVIKRKVLDTKKICNLIARKQNFPNKEIINIYSCSDDEKGDRRMSWKTITPNIDRLIGFLNSKFQLDPSYIKRVTIPIMSTLFLRDMAFVADEGTGEKLLLDQYKFDSIKSEGKRNGYNSWKIKWKCVKSNAPSNEYGTQHDGKLDKIQNDYFHLPEICEADGCSFLLTNEHPSLVQLAFPKEAAKFLEEQTKNDMNVMTPARRVSDEFEATPGAKMSSTKFKPVQIEKDSGI